MTFAEDSNREQGRTAAANLALIRKLALTLLKKHPAKESLACKRLHAALDVDFLQAVLSQGGILRSWDAFALATRSIGVVLLGNQSAKPSHLQITFSVGTSLLVIAPITFDVGPARQDSGVVYCEMTYAVPLCNGSVHDVLCPGDFNRLATALTRMAKGEAASVSVAGLDGWFRLDGDWNAEEQVAAFKITMPARLGPGGWSLWHEPSHYRGSMKTCVELEYWVDSAALEELLVELERCLSMSRRCGVPSVFKDTSLILMRTAGCSGTFSRKNPPSAAK